MSESTTKTKNSSTVQITGQKTDDLQEETYHDTSEDVEHDNSTTNEVGDQRQKNNHGRLFLSNSQRFWVLWYISRAQGILNAAEEDIGFKVCRKTRELLEANAHRHKIDRAVPNSSLRLIMRQAHKFSSVEPVYKRTGRPKITTCRERVKELLEDKDMSTRSIANVLSQSSIPISRETVRRIAKEVLTDSTKSR